MAQSITAIVGRMILDSRGNPTVEVDLTLADGSFGRAAAPSGASTGSREALELRDGGKTFTGKGVQQALDNIKNILTPALLGQTWEQASLDQAMLDLDGTDNFSKLGANAVLPISLAFAVASARSAKMPLYRWIAQLTGSTKLSLPRPMWNIMNGGAHANWTTDIQEYMIQSPHADLPFIEQVRMATEVYHSLYKVLDAQSLSVQVGNEGGYAPDLESNAQALELILEAIQKAGYTTGRDGDFMLALDVAASEFYQDGMYNLRRDKQTLSSAEMVGWLEKLIANYPMISLEDGLAESDWPAWQDLTQKHGEKVSIIGDDLLVTNPKIVAEAVKTNACNAIIIKPNQIGTLSLTLEAMRLARNAGWKCIPAHRSGETEDTFIAHLAVGTGAGYIKTGAPSRTDRTAKYNELLRISETL